MNRADGTFLIISVPAELAEVKRENAELRRKLHEMEIRLACTPVAGGYTPRGLCDM